MVKNRLTAPESRAIAQRVLAHTLDTLLRLLHPMIPFVTEEVWQLLGRTAPQRGIAGSGIRENSAGPGGGIRQNSKGGVTKPSKAENCEDPRGSEFSRIPLQAAESVMIAPWPEADLAWQDAEIEARFARFQEVLKGLREIRCRQNIPPKTQIDFAVRCDAASAALLRPMEPSFESMAGARARGWGVDVAPPATSASYNLPGLEIFVDLTGLIDVEAEISRNEKELAKLSGLIEAKEKKLANESFVARAPADVVAKERASLAEMQDRLASTTAYLAELRQRRPGE
jgi:valyl-tRNA synthetase